LKRDAAAGFLGRGRKIMWINVLLSGDNALVIACVPWTEPRQRLWAWSWVPRCRHPAHIFTYRRE